MSPGKALDPSLRAALDAAVRREWRARQRPVPNERVAEYRFLFDCLTATTPSSVLDVGTGKTALPHLLWTSGYVVTAIDNVSDYWPEGSFNRHFFVRDHDITDPHLDTEFDFISCLSVLEHIQRFDAAFAGMMSLLKPKGWLAVSFPYCESQFISNAYDLPDASFGKNLPFETHIFSRREVDRWSADHGCTILKQEYWQAFTGAYWTLGDRIWPPERVDRDERHHLTCILFRKY
jgi:SAM-dependent methyltransferase